MVILQICNLTNILSPMNLEMEMGWRKGGKSFPCNFCQACPEQQLVEGMELKKYLVESTGVNY